MNRIINGNILSFARHYHGDPFHAIFCDPPYHLTSIVKRFSKGEPEHTKTFKDIQNRSTPHARQAKGFMNQVWDGGDVAFKPDTWKALADLLYPGAFIFAFAGTRGYHRMAVSMEDAGLIIHPAIGWVFGSGFPKATRIDRQIDEAAGVPIKRGKGFNVAGKDAAPNLGIGDGSKPHSAVTDSACVWQGHRYGLQALKPAFEFIAVAQKPYKGRSVDCISKTGAGALNIEGARIGVDEVLINTYQDRNFQWGIGTSGDQAEYIGKLHQGRWPANFALCHSPECERECVEGCPVKMMDDQSGIQSGGFVRNQTEGARPFENNGKPTNYKTVEEITESDSGASRYFFNADYMHERLEDSDPVMYQAKAGRSERNAGLVGMEEKSRQQDGDPNNWDLSEGKVRERLATAPQMNHHPTIKPISLCKWLATLLLPPDSYSPRRLLIPFSGAGSEMIGATLAGWDHIIGVEMESEYAAIARARLAWWEQKLTDGHTDLDRMLKQWNIESESEESDDEQLSLL